tara:strand:- start:3684 stop:3797 length:114 start_codon:yes stop_codon:yes gene_type:complete
MMKKVLRRFKGLSKKILLDYGGEFAVHQEVKIFRCDI